MRPFPPGTGAWQVSTAGGGLPAWRRDGKELYYISLDYRMMAVPVETTPKFHAGAPVVLFPIRASAAGVAYDISADGQRFLVHVPASDVVTPPLDLFVNWTALLPKR